MRIVAGRFGGKALATPKSNAIRPTSDRVRESLFNILAHNMDDFDIEGARVIDLFAGTGALGLEALSRGASYVHFVEENVEARGLIRRNIELVGAMGVSKIYRRDATKLGDAGTLKPFNLLFADPPYGKGLADKALGAAWAGQWLQPNALCVIEEQAGSVLVAPDGFERLDCRIYGDTAIYFYRAPG